MHHAYIALAAFALPMACASEATPPAGSAAAHGESLFVRADTGGTDNTFACATCHATAAASDRVRPGAMLAGVTARPSYWGGAVLDLLDAINACRVSFMSAERPWIASDEDARAMYAYLASLPSTSVDAAPFTVVRTTSDVAPGDAARGSVAYDRTCRGCHGALHTADGRPDARIPALPDDVARAHSPAFGYAPSDVRLVFVEKARHGAFLGYSGRMPPFSREALTDAELADILAFLGL